MQDEQIFRLILVLGFVAVFPVGLYHRLKAQASKDKLDRRQEGLFILLTLRPIALVKMLGMLGWVILDLDSPVSETYGGRERPRSPG